MIFKEIQMDIPFYSNRSDDDLLEEYERTWKWKRRQFQLMTRCMTSMIERLLPSIKSKDYWKLLIECVKDKPKDGYTNLLGVCVVQIPFDIDCFFEMDNLEKKRYIIEKIIYTVYKLSECGLCEFLVIENICNEIINDNYVNEWFWKKPIKKGCNSVQIKLIHDVDDISIYMVFNPNMNSEIENLLIKTVPDEWIYNKFLGKLEWVSDTKAQLISKDGEIFCCDFCDYI